MLSEYLLDQFEIDDLQGVVQAIVRPTKYGSNPVHGNNSWTWDNEINYSALWKISSTIYLFYRCFENADGATPRFCYSTSADGLTFSHSNLGLITYGGNTNNNLLTSDKSACSDVYYESGATPVYLGCGESANGSVLQGVRLYSSANGTTWSSTPYKILYTSIADGDYREGKCVIKRPDGRYLCYYQHHSTAASQRRQIGVYLSDSTDPSSTWTDKGIVIDCQSQDDQRYHLFVRILGDVYVGWMGKYNRTTETMTTSIWVSRDGMNWRVADDSWMGLGSAATWEDKQIWATAGFIEMSNEWWHYYIGSEEDHATFPRNSKMGLAKQGKARFGSIGTTGTVRLKKRTLGASDTLTVNCDASGGSLKVELLDHKNEVLPGYSRDDFTPITTDTYGTAASWGGTGLPASETCRIVFVLTSATLYSFTLG